jgi:hypothetical protein
MCRGSDFRLGTKGREFFEILLKRKGRGTYFWTGERENAVQNTFRRKN